MTQESWTLKQTKEWLKEQLFKGTKCPCCGQRAQIHRRNINRSMARVILFMRDWFKKNKDKKWMHVERCISENALFASMPREYQKLRYWDLLESNNEISTEGTPHNGLWRLTDSGKKFADGELAVPKYMWIYNDKPVARSKSKNVFITNIISRRKK